MFNVSTLIRSGPWLLACFFFLLSMFLKYEWGLVQDKLEIANANQATLQAGLNVAETFNQSLNASISELQQVVIAERLAFLDVQQHAADVDKRMNSAVSDIKGLFDDEDELDSCGNRRLPQLIIDRMWQYYRSASGDGSGN